jgi:hypothetical protein
MIRTRRQSGRQQMAEESTEVDVEGGKEKDRELYGYQEG